MPTLLDLKQEQTYLQDIMKNAGFSRFCGEWWHFELSSQVMSSACEPGVYQS